MLYLCTISRYMNFTYYTTCVLLQLQLSSFTEEIYLKKCKKSRFKLNQQDIPFVHFDYTPLKFSLHVKNESILKHVMYSYRAILLYNEHI